MLHFALCDDEPYFLDALSDRLADDLAERQLPDCRLHHFSNGRALLDSPQPFDLIFLDVQMPPPDGLETAHLLRERGCKSLLVFLTVLSERVFDAFAVQPYDYLLKPLEPIRFQQMMDRAVRDLTRQVSQCLIVQRNGTCHVIPLSQLVYCEVLGRKVYLHQTDGTVIDYYEKLETLAQQLDERFFRCHRSYLVNLSHIRGCRAGRVMLAQGEEIPVSRRREDALVQALLCHMKEKGC